VALAKGGRDVRAGDAAGLIWGYAVGLDMTRRDLQNEAKKQGRPWCIGKAFDEAAAILAGDSLLTYAFDIVASPETVLAAERKVQLTVVLARAAGIGGMAGGQALDLEAETRSLD